ncbi:unnamed protein product [Amoebophrya sp. A120]|nr:unnamed protein product [Amoebophrya sp. A120]|eukprot:GSA120T00017833001.1
MVVCPLATGFTLGVFVGTKVTLGMYFTLLAIVNSGNREEEEDENAEELEMQRELQELQLLEALRNDYEERKSFSPSNFIRSDVKSNNYNNYPISTSKKKIELVNDMEHRRHIVAKNFLKHKNRSTIPTKTVVARTAQSSRVQLYNQDIATNSINSMNTVGVEVAMLEKNGNHFYNEGGDQEDSGASTTCSPSSVGHDSNYSDNVSVTDYINQLNNHLKVQAPEPAPAAASKAAAAAEFWF